MKKSLLLLHAFLSLFFSNNIFLFAVEDDSITYKRNLWFYAQRFNPYDSIPPGAMQNALSERSALLVNGYYLNPMSNSWVNIGPNYPRNGGRLNFVKYADANTVIVGAPHGGLWRSTNNTTWVSMDPNNQLSSYHSGSIAVDNSHNPPFIYYGTGEGIYGFDYAYFGKGIFKTTDWGNTWEEINNGLPINLFLKVFRITIRPEHPDEIFAATNQGLYRTSTGGINWFVIDGTYGKNCNDIKFSYQEPLKAYLVGPDENNRYIPGVSYRESTDGGLTFEVKDRGFNPYGRTHIEVFEQNDNYIFAISDIDDNTKLYRSTNGGLNFIQKFSTNMTNYDGYVMSLKVVPTEQGDVPTDIYVGGIYLYKSTNTGESFCRITGGNEECGYPHILYHDDYHYIDVKPGAINELFMTNDGGVFKSANSGFVWESFNSNLSLSLIYRINSGPNATFLGLQDNGIGTLTTTKYPFSDGGEVIVSKFDPSVVLYNANNDGNLRRSIDGGSNYSIISIPGYWGTAGADWIGAISEHPSVSGTLYHAKRDQNPPSKINFWKSTNFGANWSSIGSGANGICAPQTIAISNKEPQKIYMSSSGFFGDFPFSFGRGLFKSENNGGSWEVLIPEDYQQTIPFKYITRVITAPSENSANPDEVYLTLSGFENINEGHVFKSTNEGANWININGNLPNTPANDIIWWQSGCEGLSKTIAVATDIGVFSSTNDGDTWKLIAEGLPIVPVMDLEYVQYKNSLRAATFGRGVWEVDLEGDIYIKENVTVNQIISIDKNIYVCDGGTLNINGSSSEYKGLRMGNGKRIIVQDGGRLTGNYATFYKSLDSWDGIVIEPGGDLIFDNCYIDGAPILLNGSQFGPSPAITISNCNFLSSETICTLELNNRENVTISHCTWSYPGSYSSLENAIVSVNSNNLLIDNNDFNIASNAQDIDFSAIFIDYGTDIVVSNNHIKKMALGITVSNASPFIYRNTIESASNSSNTMCGLTLTNSYSGNIKQNTILDFETGVKLVNSSPLLFENTIVNDISHSNAVECLSVSSPRLRPQEINGVTFWDAGKNTLTATTNGGFGISMYYYSIPELDYGCNQFNTASYSLEGNIASGLAGNYYLFARNNSWNSFTQNVFDAYFDEGNPTCSPGEGGSEREKEDVPPPQPIVVNYGNGIYDTIQVTTRNIQVSSDQALYLSANNDEITGNYQSAITKYEQVIQNYQDSLTAINSLRKLLHCKDKMNGDTTAYSQLRGYYQAKVQANLTDTAFVNVAEELAAKCLVRMGHPTNAIDEYEVIISNTNDSAKILCAELNIIETYLIIQNSGDSPNYTGQLGYLKPIGKKDAYNKIMDRLHKGKNKKPVNQLPKEYQLSQNYPNPFNPVTKIKYALPYASNVNLKVYDILGREVISLVNEFKAAGSYIVEFNGKNYASGVYFYRIEAEGQNGRKYVERKKMVLVK